MPVYAAICGPPYIWIVLQHDGPNHLGSWSNQAGGFVGAREGMVFKRGERGIGYYRDLAKGQVAVSATHMHACGAHARMCVVCGG